MELDSSPSSVAHDAPAAPLHVLHVADGDFFDRFGQMLRQLGLGLFGEGVRVSLLTDDGQAVQDLEGTPVEAQGIRRLSGWRAWRLGGYLASRFSPPPSLVHVWGTACLGALADWTQRAATPLLIHMTSKRDLLLLRRRGVRANQHVAAICMRLGKALQERWPLLAGSIHFLPPALLTPAEVDAARAPDRTLGVLCVGRLDETGSVQVLIDAVAQLRRTNCDMQVALLGSGRAERAVWQEVRRAGVADSISLIDEPELWERALLGVDVCVVPTCQENISLAPLMAMALAKVVIASRDQLAEWFVEDQTAWQFTPGSPVELAYHLARAAERHPDAAALARSAAAYTREHHAITRLIEQLTELYERLTSARHRLRDNRDAHAHQGRTP